MSNIKHVKFKIDPLFILRFRILKALENRAEHKFEREYLPTQEDIKSLPDDYLENKLQSFCEKMRIDVVGVSELDYVADKILSELKFRKKEDTK